jgi:hypothetical protein
METQYKHVTIFADDLFLFQTWPRGWSPSCVPTSSVIIPNIPLLSETAIARAGTVLSVFIAALRVAQIARFPVVGSPDVDRWFDALLLLFLFILILNGEGIAEVVVWLGIVWLRLAGVETFADFLFFAFAGICVAVVC